jgi:hypothetical protein
MPVPGLSPKLAPMALPPPTNCAATYATMNTRITAASTTRSPPRSWNRAAKKSGMRDASWCSLNRRSRGA